MVPKSDNTKKSVAKKTAAQAKPDTKKSQDVNDDELDEDLDDLDDEVLAKPSKKKGPGKSKPSDDDEDAEDDIEVEDDWEKTEEEDTWDPDFDEFDIPKATPKKTGLKKADDDDLKLDEDFKEFGLFDDMEGGGTGFDDDDDF